MKTKIKIFIYLLIAIFIVWIVIAFLANIPNLNRDSTNQIPNINNSVQEPLKPKITYLIFYENNSNCFMNGKFYVDDILLGEAKDGKYELSLALEKIEIFLL